MKLEMWFAAGGGIAKTGPFETQTAAFDSLRLVSPPTAFPFPRDVVVWPEMVEVRRSGKGGYLKASTGKRR
jgi:hypothetical protein